MGIKVLSLYDGMSCGNIAFKNLGIDIDEYISYEIDKYAIAATQHNFPNVVQMGDVYGADFTQHKDVDWLIGGFPCTKFSIAQKNGRETEPYGGLGWELFMHYKRALNEAKPKYFLAENNKSMAKPIRDEISRLFGFEPILINSALVSAQNRQRLYWVGIRQANGTYRKANIEQPEDRGILLRDVLDSGIAYRNEKSYCIDANYFKATNGTDPFNGSQSGQRLCVAESVCVAQRGRYADTGKRCIKGNGPVEQFYEAREDGKTNAITTVQKDNAVAEPVRVGDLPNSDGHINGSQAMRIYAIDGKSVNLVAGGGGMGGKTGLYAVPCENVGDSETVRKAIPQIVDKLGYLPEMFNAYNNAEILSKSPTLSTGSMVTSSCATCKIERSAQPIYEVLNGFITIKDKQYPIKLADGYYIIRKLTVSECKRLQTVPEWYDFSVISNSQAYKCLGNGWTVDVIVHLIESAVNT